MSGRMVVAVEKVVVKLYCRVGHLQPSHIDAVEEIIRKGWNFATINDEVVHLVAPEAANGRAQHVGILDVPTVGHNLDARLGKATTIALQMRLQVPREPPAAGQTLRARV